MESPKLTRRTLLKAGAGAAAFATTTNIFTPLKTFAARDQKLIFWLQPNFNPTADKILEDQTRAFAKQAGLKDSELQILKVPGGEIPTRMAAALEVNAPPDVTRLEEGYVARMRAQKALLDITDIMAEMKKVPGGVNASVIPLTEDGGRNFAVPMGLNPEVMHARMDLLEQAGYSTLPRDLGEVRRGLAQDQQAAVLRLRDGPRHLPRQRQHRGHHGHRVGVRGQHHRQAEPGGLQLARRRQGLPAHQGHVPEAPDHPEGHAQLGQLREQQGLPVEAGGLRLQPAERLLLPPAGGQGDGGEDRPLPGPGRTGRPREARLRRLLRRLQGEPVPRHRQGAHPPLRRAEELQRVHHGDGRPVPADLSEAPRGPVLVVEQGVRGPGRHRQERRDDRAARA